MADGFVILNPGLGGEVMDEESIGPFPSGPTTRLRSRVIVAGSGMHEIAKVSTSPPTSTDYGLVVRPIFDPNYPVSVTLPGTSVTSFAEITSISANIETTITSYVVPVGKIFSLAGFVSTGNVEAKYIIKVNGVENLVIRTTPAMLTGDMSFKMAFPLATAGQTVSLTTIHDIMAVLGEFQGTILGFINDA